MYIYLDKATDDELFSDTYKIKDNGFYYTFVSKYGPERGYQLDEALIGANPSAEEEQEDAGGAESSGKNDFCFAFAHRLHEMQNLDKKEVQKYLKRVAKNDIAAKKQEVGDSFDEKAYMAEWQEVVQKIIKNFDNYAFYCGENSFDNAEHAVCFVEWSDDGVSGTVTVFKHDVKGQKC